MKELQLMKVIHDLKNPIMSIKQLVSEINGDINQYNSNDFKSESMLSQAIPEKYEEEDKRISYEIDMKIIPDQIKKESDQNEINNSSIVNSELQEAYVQKDTNKYQPLKDNQDNHKSNNYNSMKMASVYNYKTSSQKLNSFNSQINEQSYSKNLTRIKKSLNAELEDIDEMIENLRTEFKSNNQMDFKEEIRPVKANEFISSLYNTHSKLVETTQNLFVLSIEAGFPRILEIQKSLVKRILNNFITNALKHTNNGKIEVLFDVIDNDQLIKLSGYYYRGNLTQSQVYYIFTIKDNGSGIPKDKIGKIFDEKESDQSHSNWEGTGLGLPICEKLAKGIGATIFYQSEPNHETEFLIVIPKKENSKQSDDYDDFYDFQTYEARSEVYLDKRADTNVKTFEHVCNCLWIVDDCKHILKRYERYLEKKRVPFKTFINAVDLLSSIKLELKHNCNICKEIILLSDYYMPYMNGLQLAEYVTQVDKDRRVHKYLLSADEPKEELVRLNLFKNYFTKPVNMKIFLDLHKKYYGKKRDNYDIK